MPRVVLVVRLVLFLCLFGSSVLFAGDARAATLTASLDGLLGAYTAKESGRPISSGFDVGSTFSSITDVSVEITGYGTDGWYDLVHIPSSTPCCTTNVLPSIRLRSNEPYPYYELTLQDFGTTSTVLSGSLVPLGGLTYDDFLSGTGTIDGWVNPIAGLSSELDDQWTVWAQLTITSAQISITGTVIPEPATGTLVAFGGIALGLAGRVRRRARA